MSRDIDSGELCRLSFRTDNDGHILIVDDLGRTLKGVRGIDINARYNDATEMFIKVFAYSADGKHIVNRRKANGLTVPPIDPSRIYKAEGPAD